MSTSFRTRGRASSSSPRTPTSGQARQAALYRHLLLWVLQTWLALSYAGAGYAKLSQPQELLSLLMTWPGQVDVAQLHAIGWAEIALAACIVAPLISWRIFRPVLMVGALGVLIDAAFMTVFHALQRGPGLALLNGLIVLMALAVIVGRWPGQAHRPGSSAHAV